MGIDDGFDIPKTPIGKPPSDEQLAQWEERAKLERLNIDFIDLGEHPKFVQAIDIIKSNINRERKSQGLPVIENGWPEIRYIDNSGPDWNNVAVSAGLWAEPTRGFFDDASNVIFLECDKKTFGSDPEESIYDLYTIAHEIGHFVIPIQEYSFHLSEGVVDNYARQWLNQEVVDGFLGDGRYAVIKSKIDDFVDNFVEYKGQELTPDDIVIIKDKGEVLGATRTPEVRMVNAIRANIGEVDYGSLLNMAFKGDIEGIGNLIRSRLGEDVEKLLNDPKHRNDVAEIQKLILSKAQNTAIRRTRSSS